MDLGLEQKRKRSFDEAANLPFADDDIDQNSKGVQK